MNIYDIAKKAGVSASTVSKVLNNYKNVNINTRKKVLDIVDEYSYEPNMVARNLSKGTSNNIAYIIPDIENSFFSKILHGVTTRAREAGYNVIMMGTDSDCDIEHDAIASLKPEFICALLITSVSQDDENTAKLLEGIEKQGIPIVLVDRDVLYKKYDGVFSDDVNGALDGVNCLINAGHKKIAMITGPSDSRPGFQRFIGYKRALKDAGIKLREDYVVSGYFKEDASYEAVKKIMNLEDPPTAIFTSNNKTTLGCLKYFKENNMKIGEDISIVAFDDIPELINTDCQITSITRPVYDMGREAMSILIDRLSDEKKDSIRVARRYIVDTKVVKRGSEKMRKIK